MQNFAKSKPHYLKIRQKEQSSRNHKSEAKNALQNVYDSLNQRQQKKIVKDEVIKALFDPYGVERPH